jgi:hypothetical protein
LDRIAAPETTTEDNTRLRAAVRLYEHTRTPVVLRGGRANGVVR